MFYISKCKEIQLATTKNSCSNYNHTKNMFISSVNNKLISSYCKNNRNNKNNNNSNNKSNKYNSN